MLPDQHFRQPKSPPPWWPADEPWPPFDGGSRRGAALGRRFAILLFALLVLTVFAVIILTTGSNWSDDHPTGRDSPTGPDWLPALALLVIGSAIILISHRLIRTFRPLAEVVDASNLVAGGDYSVRVPGRPGRDSSGVVTAFNTISSRLESNEQQRQRLLADIAHEIRTPMAVVQGTIEAMLDGVYPMEQATLVPLLDRTHAVSHLLNDLQTLASTEAGALSLHRLPTSINELVDEVVTSFEPMAHRSGVHLIVKPGAVADLEIDRLRIRQVIDNLLMNAIRHTPSGGSIVITTTTGDVEVSIAVADTGRGITPEETERMFERFVKAADSGGNGLGLAIARGLVEAHGGTINALSTLHVGTTVTVTLPRFE